MEGHAGLTFLGSFGSFGGFAGVALSLQHLSFAWSALK